MKYKGYVGKAVYDSDAKIFHGEVVGLRDVITFQGKTVDELEQAFRGSIDVYLEWCKKRGEAPEKSFSGSLNIRMPTALHAMLAQDATLRGVSLNTLIIDKLKK